MVPARNEAAVIPATLPSLLQQEYSGDLHVVLVDDNSTDGTHQAATHLAIDSSATHRLTVIEGQPLPPGWSGKLWAMSQGVQASACQDPGYLLFVDADIHFSPHTLSQLVSMAQSNGNDLVSVMAHLKTGGFWDRLLIPAFVFFFAKIYPFRQVNNSKTSTAAAAGGCMLVRADSLAHSGGLENIRSALIDDCALARQLKTNGLRRKIWLGLSPGVRSLRPYQGFPDIWNMVARTAYTQLDYSPLRLLATVIGMTLVYLVPPTAAGLGLATLALGHLSPTATSLSDLSSTVLALASFGVASRLLMTACYMPMVRHYRLPWPYAFTLPFIASLYTAMTIQSALRHWRGTGAAWKDRTYPIP